MRALSLLCLLGLGSCKNNDLAFELPDGAYVNCDGGSVIPDMTTKPPCAAAEGLTGYPIICVDFSTITSINDPQLANWNFSTNPAGGWNISNGKLQFVDASNFGTYTYTAAPIFIMRALDPQEFAKYNRFAFSVVHSVDISDTSGQKAQIMMGKDDSINRLIDQTTGKQPRKQWIHTLAKSDVAGGTYQPWFKFSQTTTAGGAFRGWQIESIAIQGLP